jgi:hypothetical protein
MNPAKYTEVEYINFLIATQKVYSCSEAERVQLLTEGSASHDAINRLLHRIEPDPKQVKVMVLSSYSRLLLQTATLIIGLPMTCT